MTPHHALLLRARLSAVLMRSTRYRGTLVLVLWQVPVEPVIRPNGSIGFMIGGGGDEHADLSCEGDLMSAERVTYRVAAVEADYSGSERVRVDAVAGYMHSDHDSHDGAFAALQVRGDWSSAGVGAGFMLSPSLDQDDPGTSAWPSLYARVGAADGLHLRGDVLPPVATGPQQMARLGLGFNAVNRDEGSFFVGIAALGNGEGSTGITAELSLPAGPRLALEFNGHYAGGRAYNVSALTAGGRFRIGGMPRARASVSR